MPRSRRRASGIVSPLPRITSDTIRSVNCVSLIACLGLKSRYWNCHQVSIPYTSLAPTLWPTNDRLAASLIEVGADELHPYSWLLPNRFYQYLRECYFADFE